MNRVFDFHTHILPGIDDGAKSIDESLAMIKKLAQQGAYGIAATPHFYANRASPERFFAKRKAAWEQLKPYICTESLDIRLGSEVQYFEGIQRYCGLEQFCIGGTRLLLIEMPLCTWTNRMVSAILEVNARENIVVLLAHVERYLPYRNDRALKAFREQGVLIQASTAFFIEKSWTAMRMLRKGQIHLLGTDSHNMDDREPNLEQALETISRKKGTLLLQTLAEREVMLLNEEKEDLDWLRPDPAIASRIPTILL